MLYILCGLPFAGKTTLAKVLVEKFGFVRVDLDQINDERGLGGIGNDDISSEDWKITYDESYRRVAQALFEEKTVINDTANFTKEQRDKLRAIAKKHNAPTKVIYVAVTEAVARKRWQENRVTNTRYDVRGEDFAEVADNFQPPTEDENVLTFDQSEPLEEWIKKNISLETTAKEVIALYNLLAEKGIDVWIDGGWAVDALLGKQTRAHEDLDIVVQQKNVSELRALLAARGYNDVPREDRKPWNFGLGDNKGHRIDVHVIIFDEKKNGIYGPKENGQMYPSGSLNGIGTIAGKHVKSITPEHLVKFHTGYKLDENDIRDVSLLCEKFGIDYPMS